MADLEIDKITEMIIGAAHKVSNTLGSGFIEHVYENALAHQTRKDGLPACLLINFGQPRIQLRRLYPSPTWKVSKSVG